MSEQLRSSFKLRHVWCRLRPSNRSHTTHLRWGLQRTEPITHCLPLLADKSYCTIDDSAILLQLSVGSCAVALAIPVSGDRWARHLLRSYGGSSSYPAGNKPVDIQSTTHKIKVRFIVKQQTLHIHQNRPSKKKVADKTKRKRKEALFFGLTLPYKQTSYGTAKVHTLNLLECSEFNSCLFCLDCFTRFP